MKKNKKSPVVASSTQPTEGLGHVTQRGASRSGRGAALKQGAAVSANAAAHGGCSTSSVSLSGAKAVPAYQSSSGLSCLAHYKLCSFQLAYRVIFHSSGAGVYSWELAVTIFCCVWGKKLINTKLNRDLSCLTDLLQKCVSSRPFIIDFALSTNSARKG